MDSQANSDLFFLQDEKFDFDVSLSPASSKEDEDEVFVNPVSHKEKTNANNITSQLEERCVGSGVQVSWSPLTGDQLEAVCQEAHKLASQLQSDEANAIHSTTDIPKEEFVQDTEAKLGMLGRTASALSPIKRKTFCVQDSPMKQLPPAVQCHLLRGGRPSTSSTRPPTAARLGTSSPAAGARAQQRISLRGKATLGVAAVLPSKPVPPAASCSTSKSRVNKTRLQPPSKTAGVLRQSPSSRPANRAKSCEDLLSDSASMASDISDSSLNSSLLGQRPMAPPTKSVGVRNLSGVVAPPLQNRRVTDRKNTSSSSSSVSSFNSSISLSPAKGNMNSCLNRSTSTGPTPSSVSRPANPRRSRRYTVEASAEPVSSIAGRRSLSIQAKKLPETERLKSSKSTPLKRVDSAPLQPTPAKRVMERTASVSSAASGRLQSGLKVKPKPEALVFPTPNTAGKGVPQAKDASRVLKPKRLMSAGSTDSLPQKTSAGPLTPSMGSCRSLEVKTRRPSALPTPVKRKMSVVAALTTQTIQPLAVMDSDASPAPISGRKQHSRSPIPKEAKEEQPDDPPVIQPFSLEEEEPLTTPSSVTEPTQTENVNHETPAEDETVSTTSLVKVQATEETVSKTREVLLLDLPVPTPQPPEKLLIDLTNTPDLIRTGNNCTTTQQLIDLSSPLIKWSPDDKRENNAPLINLSF